MSYGSKISRTFLTAVACAALLTGGGLYAAEKAGSEHGHEAAPTKKGGGSGPSMEMHMSMMKSMKEMQAMKPTGNMDYDFAMMMRHHHAQGIQMAEQELKHGKDQKMRDMAQKIVDSQKKEIAEFDEWLKAKPKGTGAKSK